MLLKNKDFMKQTQKIFSYSFAGIGICLIVLFVFYRNTFDGNLSSDISDWIAFVNLFNGIGILLLTALNVWIFYKLTLLIAENEEKHRLYESQKDALNNLIHTIYAVFQPDVENPICEINRKSLGRVYHKLELMRDVYTPICKEFGNDEFAQFVEEFRRFCLDYFKEESPEAEGKDMQREAFDFYLKALQIEMQIGKAMNAK